MCWLEGGVSGEWYFAIRRTGKLGKRDILLVDAYIEHGRVERFFSKSLR